MCRVRTNTYKCGHFYKISEPDRCNMGPNCVDEYAILLEWNRDLSATRRCIRDTHTHRTLNNPDYDARLAFLKTCYKDFFNRASGNLNKPLQGLTQLDAYLTDELRNQILPTLPTLHHPCEYCMDHCWEGVLMREREEAEKRAVHRDAMRRSDGQ